MKRFECKDTAAGARMKRDDDGYWVSWDDHQTEVAKLEADWDTTHKKAVAMVDNLRARVAELERSLKIQCDHAAELEKETAAWSRESIRLSPEDQAVFAEALLNPPPMAEPLKRAFERLASLTK